MKGLYYLRKNPRGLFRRRTRYPLVFVTLFLIISLFYFLNEKTSITVTSSQKIKPGSSFRAFVMDVIDGDTITLKIDGSVYSTRLIGIDAPEIGQRPWGERSKRWLRKLVKPGGKVTVETDVEVFDKYNRLLIYLFTEDGKFINKQMLVDGYAVLFTIPPNVKYVDRLHRAQQQARNLNKGIWGKSGLKEMPIKYRERQRGER